MDEKHLYFENLIESVTISPDGIASRTLRADENGKSIVFGFDKGQGFSEHIAAVPAIIHVISGEAEVVLDGQTRIANAGSWIWMPAKMPHSVVAKTPVVMLLTLFKSTKDKG